MTDGEFYWCLDHKRAEGSSGGCPRDRQLGPYPSAEAAAHWKEQFEARNDSWDEADRKWECED